VPNWNDVLQQMQQQHAVGVAHAQSSIDIVRRSYLQELHKYTSRNIIAYYSGWLSKPGIAQAEINDEDKNGFMMAVHKLDKSKGVDLILHTPGGSIAATQSIVDYLHKIFGQDMRAIVPQIAMSAGTMMACACKEIWMGKHSNLGPIDPHLRGIPAHGVVKEFKRAVREVKKDPDKLRIWQQIIGQYRPTFLSQCENGIKWASEFVEAELAAGMLAAHPNAKDRARAIAKKLANYQENKSHERHIHAEECEKIGLTIKKIEVDGDETFQDLILTVHHCYMHTLMNTNAFKVIENQTGVAFVKNTAG
jgi:ATP-dependent protease ClpP protease subunit